MKITKAELEQKYLTSGVIALAEEFDVTIPTVYRYLRNAGIEIKGRGRPKKIEVREN